MKDRKDRPFDKNLHPRGPFRRQRGPAGIVPTAAPILIHPRKQWIGTGCAIIIWNAGWLAGWDSEMGGNGFLKEGNLSCGEFYVIMNL